jgi:hypothetical protein
VNGLRRYRILIFIGCNWFLWGEIILKVSKILRKIKIDYSWIFNPLQKWDFISLKFKIFTWNIAKLKILS